MFSDWASRFHRGRGRATGSDERVGMDLISDSVEEYRGEPFRPQPLAHAFSRDPELLLRLATVVAVIKGRFLSPRGWRFRVHEGSLTLQHRRDAHEAIKVFVDVGNVLADRTGVAIHPDPVVVGVELTEESPFVRRCIRDALAAEHGELYLDPRKRRPDSLDIVRNRKYWISPHSDHLYDILFLRNARCGQPVGPETIETFAGRIRDGLGPRRGGSDRGLL